MLNVYIHHPERRDVCFQRTEMTYDDRYFAYSLWCEICCESNNTSLRKTNVWFKCSRTGEFKHKYKANGILKYNLIEIRLLRFHQVISLVFVKPKCFSLPSNLASVFHHSMKSRRKDNDKKRKHSDFNMYMTLTLILGLPFLSYHDYMGRVKRIWYLSPMRAAKVQASLRIRAVAQKARSLALLNGWVCAVTICHDGMLEGTNSLDSAHMTSQCLSSWNELQE